VNIDAKDFRIPPGKRMELDEWPTSVKPYFKSTEQYHEILAKHVQALGTRQDLHYASARHALLMIFQGMDSAGKDGSIKHVMSGMNPEGCEIFSFKQPSVKELKHDFLWRTTCRLPERGRIGIFNRSYYEEVLITRVHPQILDTQNLPTASRDDKHFWKDRYRSINELEAHLHRNGTKIIKFFLHLSKKEQAQRFRERIDTPDKNWKFSPSDVHERKYWKQYMRVYGECLSATSTHHALCAYPGGAMRLPWQPTEAAGLKVLDCRFDFRVAVHDERSPADDRLVDRGAGQQ
jgi:PPK2 family polyphosphate:nucleotide phosphotransferase